MEVQLIVRTLFIEYSIPKNKSKHFFSSYSPVLRKLIRDNPVKEPGIPFFLRQKQSRTPGMTQKIALPARPPRTFRKPAKPV